MQGPEAFEATTEPLDPWSGERVEQHGHGEVDERGRHGDATRADGAATLAWPSDAMPMAAVHPISYGSVVVVEDDEVVVGTTVVEVAGALVVVVDAEGAMVVLVAVVEVVDTAEFAGRPMGYTSVRSMVASWPAASSTRCCMATMSRPEFRRNSSSLRIDAIC